MMIPKNKVIYTPEKEVKVLAYIQFVALCAEMIKIEYQYFICDLRFRNPVINNHSRRIIESANQISKSLSSISENTDREGFTYESSLQAHRLFKHFTQYPVEKLEKLMDLIEQQNKPNL